VSELREYLCRRPHSSRRDADTVEVLPSSQSNDVVNAPPNPLKRKLHHDVIRPSKRNATLTARNAHGEAESMVQHPRFGTINTSRLSAGMQRLLKNRLPHMDKFLHFWCQFKGEGRASIVLQLFAHKKKSVVVWCLFATDDEFTPLCGEWAMQNEVIIDTEQCYEIDRREEADLVDVSAWDDLHKTQHNVLDRYFYRVSVKDDGPREEGRRLEVIAPKPYSEWDPRYCGLCKNPCQNDAYCVCKCGIVIHSTCLSGDWLRNPLRHSEGQVVTLKGEAVSCPRCPAQIPGKMSARTQTTTTMETSQHLQVFVDIGTSSYKAMGIYSGTMERFANNTETRSTRPICSIQKLGLYPHFRFQRQDPPDSWQVFEPIKKLLCDPESMRQLQSLGIELHEVFQRFLRAIYDELLNQYQQDIAPGTPINVQFVVCRPSALARNENDMLLAAIASIGPNVEPCVLDQALCGLAVNAYARENASGDSECIHADFGAYTLVSSCHLNYLRQVKFYQKPGYRACANTARHL
jgi:hypothetical protein